MWHFESGTSRRADTILFNYYSKAVAFHCKMHFLMEQISQAGQTIIEA